jgi:hypothetical protein
VVGGLLVLGASACGGNDNGGVDVNVNPSGVVVSSGGTTVQVGGGAEIPSGFPSEFPLPDGATPVYSASAGGSFSVWFSSSQSIEDLRAFFDSELPAGGWTVENKADFSDSTGAYSVYTISGNGYDGGVYLGEGGSAAAGFSGDFAFFVSLAPSGA